MKIKNNTLYLKYDAVKKTVKRKIHLGPDISVRIILILYSFLIESIYFKNVETKQKYLSKVLNFFFITNTII